MKELQRHRDAFELYFKLKQSNHTTTDAVRLVKGEFKVSEKTIYKWKKAFSWDGREAIRTNEIQKNIEARTNKSIEDYKTSLINLWENTLAEYTSEVNTGKRKPVQIEKTRDLETATKNLLLLMGESTERTESKVETINPELDNEIKLKILKDAGYDL